MKKNFSLRIFNLLTRRVFLISKKRKYGWSWQDCQRWTSTFLFQKYKGQKLSKIKVSQVDQVIKDSLDKGMDVLPAKKQKGQPVGAVSYVGQPKQQQNCANALELTSADLFNIEWWNIANSDVWFRFEDNLPMRIAFDSVIDTGVVFKKDLPDMKDIREDLRKQMGTDSNDMPDVIFKVLVKDGAKDDGKPCSYYVLVTTANSSFDSDNQNEVTALTSIGSLSPENIEEKQRRIELQKQKKAQNELLEKAQKRTRPKQVEPKPTKEKKKLPVAVYKELNKTLKMLERQFKEGILTRKEFLKRQQIILDKFEEGGQV